MCSIAPALGFDATAFLDRRRGVAAVAPAACGVTARKPVVRVAAAVSSSSAPTKKRPRDGEIGESEGLPAAGKVSAVPARGQGQQRLQERMRAELDAIRVLHRKAVLLCRDARRSDAAAPGAKGGAQFSAAGLRRKNEPLEAAAKRRKISPLKPAPEAKKQSTEAVKHQQHRRPIQRAMPPPPPTTKCSVAKPVDKALEIEKKRRLEEIAVAREKCRQELLEMERTALPDETIYPRDLEELGIAFQYAVTRTWNQAERSRLNGGE